MLKTCWQEIENSLARNNKLGSEKLKTHQQEGKNLQVRNFKLASKKLKARL